ncbi:MAG: ferritin [Patescibacteria group bacterium]
MKRAIDSLREEFEAVDWYKQRADACSDKDLRKILLHNMREEQEHAAMLLCWMRNKDKNLDKMLTLYLSRKPGDITKE